MEATEVLIPCWFARFDERHRPCQGRTDRAHLLSKQDLKHNRRIFMEGGEAYWERRLWVLGCRLHHGEFDAYKLTVPRESLPESFLAFAEELGLSWAVDRRFGPQKPLQAP